MFLIIKNKRSDLLAAPPELDSDRPIMAGPKCG